jgi:tungstate transport system ATP-binding protein
MEPILSIHNLEYRRGAFSLAVEKQTFLKGRIYCLTGPNGAGKSTLLHLLALLLEPDRGEILFEGTLLEGAAQRQRMRQRITLVEQAPYLFDTTVYDNLAFGLRLRDVGSDLQRRRIAKALQTVGLDGFESRRARALSGGEIRRVALARAMVLRPGILLLDEPTDGLDRRVLPLFEDCLTALSGEGVTVIIATHDADQPRRLGGEILRLDGGRPASPAGASVPALSNEPTEKSS